MDLVGEIADAIRNGSSAQATGEGNEKRVKKRHDRDRSMSLAL